MHSSEDRTLIVGARASPLSRIQVQEVLDELNHFHPRVRFSSLLVETTGDKDLNTSLKTLEKTDFFTKEIDRLLLEGKCRIAIHSAKDLPDPLPEGLRVVALTRGVDPSDSLVMKEGETLKTLKAHAKIGTSSIRREQEIRQLRSDLQCVDVRGTIERRVELLNRGEIDGLVVAEAALIRLKLTHLNRMPLPGKSAPLQGRLAVVARQDDEEMIELFSCIDARRRKRVLYLGTSPAQFAAQADLIHYPVIKIVQRDVHLPDIQEAYRHLENYTHLLFTSKNTVEIFFQHLAALGRKKEELLGKCILAIGRVTALHLEKRGLVVNQIADEETQEGMIHLLSEMNLTDSFLFLPRSSLSRHKLTQFLQENAIRHIACDLYDTQFQRLEPVPDLNLIDEIVFTSPSTVHAFFAIYDVLPETIQLTAIGPITEEALNLALADKALS